MLHRLITYLLRRHLQRLIPHADWTAEDELSLSNYLSTITGRRLLAVLQKLAIQRNASAVFNGTPHVCGQAVGYSMVLQDLQTLSGAAPQSGNYTEDPANQGSADRLEHLHP